jgi:fructose-bisphosphate aldolase class II
MIPYKDIGFVNTSKMFRDALDGGYAVPAYNFVLIEQAEAILKACIETRSPVIMQMSKRARRYLDRTITRHLLRGLVNYVSSSAIAIPVAMHLDHGDSLEECVSAIEDGFSSVMIDGSSLVFEDNIRITAEVAKYAHRFDVSVEGELGALSGTEDDIANEEALFTNPEQVAEFVQRSGVDSLAISIGNMHGLTKAIARNGDLLPVLRFKLLAEIEKRIPNFPLVLHGASSIVPFYVEQLNKFGGRLNEPIGIPEEQLREAARQGICKINIASDGFLVTTASIRKVLTEQPDCIDPRSYLGFAREKLIELYRDKNERIFGSSDRVEAASPDGLA